MKIPAFVQPDLYLGRAFNAISSSATVDVFDHSTPKRTEALNSFSFQYTSLENTRDVGGFLDVSGDISLRLMAGILKVDGSLKYLTDNTRKEGTTEIVAVMKCLTLREILDESAEPLVTARATRKEDLGTHYVKSVVSGAEVLASIKFKNIEDTRRRVIKGSVTGELPAIAKDPSLDSQLDKFFSECDVAAELEVKVYATGLKPRIATDLKSFRQLLEELPSLIMDNGRGVAMEYEIQPLESIGLEYLPCSENNAVTVRLGDVREKFDDLLSTQKEVLKYEEENGVELSVELADFAGQVDDILLQFRLAIADLSVYGASDQFEECTTAYKEGLLQSGGTRKYLAYWRKLTKPKKESGASYKLPEGEPVTVLLLGKTGSGKSATGNQIVGDDKAFKVSHGASSTVIDDHEKCQFGVRRGERVIEVIDSPGILDRKMISELKTFEKLQKVTLKELKKEERELLKIFSMAPDGIHAILLFTRYGTRLTLEDAAAMSCLSDLIGKDTQGHVIFVVTHGDEARKHAKELNMPLEDHLKKNWRQKLPPWMETLIQQAGNRLVLFDSGFKPQDDLQANVRQVSKLLKVIDTMMIEKQPFTNKITENARSFLDKEVKSAMDAYTKERDDIQKRLAKESRLPEREKSSLKNRLVELGKLIEDEKGLRAQLRQKQCEDVEKERGSWQWIIAGALTVLQMAATGAAAAGISFEVVAAAAAVAAVAAVVAVTGVGAPAAVAAAGCISIIMFLK